MTGDVRAELRRLVGLATPIIVNNLAISFTSLADVMMAGRLGATELAAVGVGNAVWISAVFFGMGVLMALSPMVAHRVGAGDQRGVGAIARQSVYIAGALSVILSAALLLAAHFALPALGVDPDIVPATRGYLGAITLGLPGMLLYLCLRFTSEGVGHTRPIMVFGIGSLGLNVLGNYLLMFGAWGLPRLGAVGCGLSSAFAMWASAAGMVVYMRRREDVYGPLELFRRLRRPDPTRLRELLALGLPIGGSVLAEVSLFSAAGLIMGVLGANAAAAHAIAMNYAATMFMVPLALHSAITVRVGQELGARRPDAARMAGWTGIALCGLYMFGSALLLLVLREPVTALYTDDPAVREIAMGLLFMATIFQMSDGLQVGAAGALRGFKDTRVPLLINILAYWGVGLPVAAAAGLWLDLGVRWQGPNGVWLGLAAGLSTAAMLQSIRFAHVSRRADLGAAP